MSAQIDGVLNSVLGSIESLEQAIPYIVTPSQHGQAIQFINQAADNLQIITLDPIFKTLSTTIRILNNGESTLLKTITYQGFILEIIEELHNLYEHISKTGAPQNYTNFTNLQVAGEFLIRVGGRITNRYKLKVTFEQEYEAKGIRAFMVCKEIQPFVRFLSMNPDLTTDQSPNLNNGLEIDVLSQESPNTLHKLVSSVLEVTNVQLFTETKSIPVTILDPPSNPNSYDTNANSFLNA